MAGVLVTSARRTEGHSVGRFRETLVPPPHLAEACATMRLQVPTSVPSIAVLTETPATEALELPALVPRVP